MSATLTGRIRSFARLLAARRVCLGQQVAGHRISVLHDPDFPPESPVTAPVPGEEYGPNDRIEPQVFNRNPRNLELLRLAHKPRGWTLEQDFREYWYRLVIERTHKHTTARLEHHTGLTVLSTSTRDWDVRQVLGKTNDLAAVKALGKLFAARCLMAGFNEFHSDYGPEIRARSEKINAFLATLEENGLSLTEPPVITALTFEDVKKTEWPWDVLEDDVLKHEEAAKGAQKL